MPTEHASLGVWEAPAEALQGYEEGGEVHCTTTQIITVQGSCPPFVRACHSLTKSELQAFMQTQVASMSSAILHCRALTNLKTLQSPVFLSTAEDGRVRHGCGEIPLDRPLLLVSNHQTYALDIGPLIEGLLRQTGLLPRGLTHPAVFQVCLPTQQSYVLRPVAVAQLCLSPVDS